MRFDQLPSVRFSQLVGRIQQRRQQILLAVGVAHARVAADARQTAVRENNPPHRLPEIGLVMVQTFSLFQTCSPGVEMQHRCVGRADDHVADIEITVMVERVVGEKVRTDVSLTNRFSSDHGFVVRIAFYTY